MLDFNDKTTTYKGNVIKTSLSLAIRLIDDFTKKEAIGCVKVIIKEGNIKATKNLSGYHTFTELRNDNYTINIISNLYFPEELVNISNIGISTVKLEFCTEGPAPGTTCSELINVSEVDRGEIVEFCNLTGDIERKKITYVDPNTGKISWAGELMYNFTAIGCTILVHKNPIISVVLRPRRFYPFPTNATLIRGILIDSSKNPMVDIKVKVANYKIETKSDESGEFVLYFNHIKDKKILIEIENNRYFKFINTNLEEGMTKSLGQIVCN